MQGLVYRLARDTFPGIRGLVAVPLLLVAVLMFVIPPSHLSVFCCLLPYLSAPPAVSQLTYIVSHLSRDQIKEFLGAPVDREVKY